MICGCVVLTSLTGNAFELGIILPLGQYPLRKGTPRPLPGRGCSLSLSVSLWLWLYFVHLCDRSLRKFSTWRMTSIFARSTFTKRRRTPRLPYFHAAISSSVHLSRFFFSFFEYSRTYIFGLTVLCSGEVLCEKGKYQLVYRQLALSKDSFQQAQLHFQHALTGPDRTKERAILLSTLYLGARLLCVV
jgi:hypothetical protein